MFKLIVNGKNGHEEGQFNTREEAQAHFDHYRTIGYWGKEEQVIEHPEIPGTPEVINDLGEVVVIAKAAVPAWTEIIPIEFTWEIVEFFPALEPISPRQIRLVLLSQGITESAVLVAINSLPSPQKEQGLIAWNHSNYFVRTEPAVEMIGSLMGLTSEQLDLIWKTGVVL